VGERVERLICVLVAWVQIPWLAELTEVGPSKVGEIFD